MQNSSSCLRYFALIIAATLLLSACDSEPPATEAAALVRPAKLLTLELASNNDYLNYPAVIKSQQLRTLSFEVSGVVKELLVIEAQVVKAGAVLAQLDQRDLLAKLSAAQAQFDNADSEYQRGVRLMKEDAISRSKFDQRKSQRDVNKSQLETAEKALQNSVLIAPFDGAIAKVSINKLQAIKSGEPAIDILGRAGFEAKINLPSSVLAKSKNNARAAMGSYVVLDAAPERRIPITYKEATLEADATSQTYQITFIFDAPDGLIILPGMNASVWFRDPAQSIAEANKISIPLTAIATDGEQKYVWLVDRQSMRVARKNIEIAPGVGVNLAVSSGLEPGDVIVAAGVSYLSPGMEVRPWSE